MARPAWGTTNEAMAAVSATIPRIANTMSTCAIHGLGVGNERGSNACAPGCGGG